MKKIFALFAVAALFVGAAVAQKGKAVPEKEVEVNYVKDFQRQVPAASDVAWWQLGEGVFKVTYADEEKSRQAMVFSSRGSETHYYVDKRYCPAAVRDTVGRMFPGYSIDEVWVRRVRGKMTYQARIVRKSGFLWWKKETDAQTLNFEVDGKYINIE